MKRINITQAATRAGFAGAFAVAAIAFASDSPPAAKAAQLNVTDPASVPKMAHAYVVNATPEQLAAIAAEHSSAKPAMSAYTTDAGNLRVITAEDLQAGASSGEITHGEAVYYPDGKIMIPLDESSAAYSVAHIGKDGKLRQACLENQKNDAVALATAVSAPEVDSNEK